MNNLEIGDIVNIRIVDNLQIVVTNIKEEKFQGVYFDSSTHEFKTTPMMPIKIANKVEQNI